MDQDEPVLLEIDRTILRIADREGVPVNELRRKFVLRCISVVDPRSGSVVGVVDGSPVPRGNASTQTVAGSYSKELLYRVGPERMYDDVQHTDDTELSTNSQLENRSHRDRGAFEKPGDEFTTADNFQFGHQRSDGGKGFGAQSAASANSYSDSGKPERDLHTRGFSKSEHPRGNIPKPVNILSNKELSEKLKAAIPEPPRNKRQVVSAADVEEQNVPESKFCVIRVLSMFGRDLFVHLLSYEGERIPISEIPERMVAGELGLPRAQLRRGKVCSVRVQEDKGVIWRRGRIEEVTEDKNQPDEDPLTEDRTEVDVFLIDKGVTVRNVKAKSRVRPLPEEFSVPAKAYRCQLVGAMEVVLTELQKDFKVKNMFREGKEMTAEFDLDGTKNFAGMKILPIVGLEVPASFPKGRMKIEDAAASYLGRKVEIEESKANYWELKKKHLENGESSLAQEDSEKRVREWMESAEMSCQELLSDSYSKNMG